MQKTAVPRKWLDKVNPLWPAQKYNKIVGRRPWLEIPLLTGLGAAGGSYGAKKLGKSPGWGAGLLGGLGLLYSVGKHLDTSRGGAGALGSLTQTDYYKKNPEAANALQRKILHRVSEARPSLGPSGNILSNLLVTALRQRRPTVGEPLKTLSEAERRRLARMAQARRRAQLMQKGGSDKQGFYMGADDEMDVKNVPVYYSTLLVEEDPFLAAEGKEVTKSLLRMSRGAPVGMTSGRNLFKTALRAGAGFGAAYTFGQGLSKVLGADKDKAKKLSKAGGIAAAVANSGIL